MPTPEMSSFFDTLNSEQLRTILECIKKCGCMCHYGNAVHFRACCTFTEHKVDYFEALLVAKPHAGEFHCHCGWTTPCRAGVPYADPPQCDLCNCYMMFPSENTGCWSTDQYCKVVQRKRYPYLDSVVEYIEILPSKKESYVQLKVGKQFDLDADGVKETFRLIELMKEDRIEQIREQEGRVRAAAYREDGCLS